jgi:hypothetical protein
MPYETFPWFRDVPVGKILKVEEPTPGHYYWPDLDVDLTEEIISHPERFPLQAWGNALLPLRADRVDVARPTATEFRLP